MKANCKQLSMKIVLKLSLRSNVQLWQVAEKRTAAGAQPRKKLEQMSMAVMAVRISRRFFSIEFSLN